MPKNDNKSRTSTVAQQPHSNSNTKFTNTRHTSTGPSGSLNASQGTQAPSTIPLTRARPAPRKTNSGTSQTTHRLPSQEADPTGARTDPLLSLHTSPPPSRSSPSHAIMRPRIASTQQKSAQASSTNPRFVASSSPQKQDRLGDSAGGADSRHPETKKALQDIMDLVQAQLGALKENLDGVQDRLEEEQAARQADVACLQAKLEEEQSARQADVACLQAELRSVETELSQVQARLSPIQFRSLLDAARQKVAKSHDPPYKSWKKLLNAHDEAYAIEYATNRLGLTESSASLLKSKTKLRIQGDRSAHQKHVDGIETAVLQDSDDEERANLEKLFRFVFGRDVRVAQ